jgi:hypothetical protein
VLVGCVAVDVRPARVVWVGRDGERYLGLVEGDVHTGGTDQLAGGVEDAVGAAKKLEQRRGLGGALPGEVVANVSPRRGSVGEQMVEVGEAVEVFAGQGGHGDVRASDLGACEAALAVSER